MKAIELFNELGTWFSKGQIDEDTEVYMRVTDATLQTSVFVPPGAAFIDGYGNLIIAQNIGISIAEN